MVGMEIHHHRNQMAQGSAQPIVLANSFFRGLTMDAVITTSTLGNEDRRFQVLPWSFALWCRQGGCSVHQTRIPAHWDDSRARCRARRYQVWWHSSQFK